MSSSDSFQHIKNLVQKLMLKEGIKEYDLEDKGRIGKGTNFLGDVLFFKVTTKDAKKVYNLIVKTAKTSDDINGSLPIGLAYQRESFMYRVIFPEMERILTAGNLKLDYVPRMYLACDDVEKETLILENLHHFGYRTWDRMKAMNMKHVVLVLEYLGRFHATSLAMKLREPAKFVECTKDLNSISDEFTKSSSPDMFFDHMFEHICKLLRKSSRDDLAKKYEEKIGNDVRKMLLNNTSREDKLVISHGDLWSNNLLFQYNKNSNDPSAVCFIDFQISTLDSPAKDLSFFLYTACDKTILDQSESLMETYYRSLSSTMEALGCTCDCFTYKDLLEHFKKYGLCSVISSIFFLKLTLFRVEEMPEFGEGLANMAVSKMTNENLYLSRILDNFTHFGDNFL
ncbi:hypothetical protein WA026_005410 [Henosepilachna vigintioctopunctata]|uniref:CHK kinase-like domain-containing protein n=1 Tax=Henosepilachna vigintioctopunctata TaxID=420089 RepID=A0AAW1U2Q9_9CUCU